MKETFTPSPFEIVNEKDRVWVKVIGIMHDRIRLSMKNINQKTGGTKG
jgi:ribosomal protein S1